MTTDLYQTLGIDRDATEAMIKSAYRNLCKVHHPHVSGGDRVKFEPVQAAYDVLMDAERRARYDETGEYDDGLEPQVVAEALGLIVAAASTGSPDGNFVDAALRTAYEVKANMLMAASENSNLAERFRKAAGRVKRKQGPNLAADALLQQAAKFKSVAGQAKAKADKMTKVCELLTEFEITGVPNPRRAGPIINCWT